jgi:aspartate 1-decarboxylase
MLLRSICKSKIHRAVVTAADLTYVGSIGIDTELLERTDIVPGEKVAVWNVTNGNRVETYAIAEPRGSGSIIINGAAAHLFAPGDVVIIVAFCLTDEPVEPRMILVDATNRFEAWLGAPPSGAASGEERKRAPGSR